MKRYSVHAVASYPLQIENGLGAGLAYDTGPGFDWYLRGVALAFVSGQLAMNYGPGASGTTGVLGGVRTTFRRLYRGDEGWARGDVFRYRRRCVAWLFSVALAVVTLRVLVGVEYAATDPLVNLALNRVFWASLVLVPYYTVRATGTYRERRQRALDRATVRQRLIWSVTGVPEDVAEQVELGG